MTLNFLIAPDFSPDRFAGVLNTVLPAPSSPHLLTPVSPSEQAQWLAAEKADLVYANPFDATDLIRNQGYIPFARPTDKFDEMVIATGAESGLRTLEDIKPGHRIALTDNKDVKLIGLRLLEPADSPRRWWNGCPDGQFSGGCAAGHQRGGGGLVFLGRGVCLTPRMTRSQLQVLVESRISDISHVVLAHLHARG